MKEQPKKSYNEVTAFELGGNNAFLTYTRDTQTVCLSKPNLIG